MQPKTDVDDLAAAVRDFEMTLPGWWWSVCVCSVSRDASCAPDRAGLDADILRYREFDDGFHCDHVGTVAESLREVMRIAIEARIRAKSTLETEVNRR